MTRKISRAAMEAAARSPNTPPALRRGLIRRLQSSGSAARSIPAQPATNSIPTQPAPTEQLCALEAVIRNPNTHPELRKLLLVLRERLRQRVLRDRAMASARPGGQMNPSALGETSRR